MYMCTEGTCLKTDVFPIDAKVVAKLREKTGAKMMDCKIALLEAKSEMETLGSELFRDVAVDQPVYPEPIENSVMFSKAVSVLKIKNLAAGEARRKPGKEGRLAIHEENGIVIGIGLSCETDFVARNSDFIAALDGLMAEAQQFGTSVVEGKSMAELSGKLGESIQISHAIEAGAGFVHGFYLHHDYKQGAIVTLSGDTMEAGRGPLWREVARQLAMHCVFAKPKYESREEVPAAEVESEKADIAAKLAADPKNAKKPPEILSKIVEGQMKKFYSSCVILDQPFFKDPVSTVGQFLEQAKAELVSFYLMEIGA